MDNVFLTAFIMGLMGSVHCIGMCGAVVGILSVNLDEDIRTNPVKLISFQLTYNSGRLLTYMLMGVIFAGFSYILADQIGMSVLEKIMRIFAAVMMILIGMFIAGFANFLGVFERAGQKIWGRLSTVSTRFLPVKTYRQAFSFGFFWGGIPCGLVYSALALTLSATPTDGGLIMLFFGLGTLPSMLAIAGFGFTLIRFLKQNIVQKVAGIIVILLGVWSLAMPLMHMMESSQINNSQQQSSTIQHQETKSH